MFYTVLLHSHLKANDFNKTIKKENRFYLVFRVSSVTSFSSYSTLLDETDINYVYVFLTTVSDSSDSEHKQYSCGL